MSNITTRFNLFVPLIAIIFFGLFTFVSLTNAQGAPTLNQICQGAAATQNCINAIEGRCGEIIPDCTEDRMAELNARGGWGSDVTPVTVDSYTTIYGCGADFTASDCRDSIRFHCNTEPSDPGCQGGPNSYTNQLLAANGQEIVQPPITATICSNLNPGNPSSITSCATEIRTYCQNQSDPTTCEQQLQESVQQSAIDRANINANQPLSSASRGPVVTEPGSVLGGLNVQNPLAFDSIEDLVVGILNALIVIAIPIIVIFIIYAGFMYVTAQGNAEKVKTATRALTFAIIGGILILGAVTITQIIAETVNSFRS